MHESRAVSIAILIACLAATTWYAGHQLIHTLYFAYQWIQAAFPGLLSAIEVG